MNCFFISLISNIIQIKLDIIQIKSNIILIKLDIILIKSNIIQTISITIEKTTIICLSYLVLDLVVCLFSLLHTPQRTILI